MEKVVLDPDELEICCPKCHMVMTYQRNMIDKIESYKCRDCEFRIFKSEINMEEIINNPFYLVPEKLKTELEITNNTLETLKKHDIKLDIILEILLKDFVTLLDQTEDVYKALNDFPTDETVEKVIITSKKNKKKSKEHLKTSKEAINKLKEHKQKIEASKSLS